VWVSDICFEINNILICVGILNTKKQIIRYPLTRFFKTLGYTDRVKKLHRYEFKSMWKEKV